MMVVRGRAVQALGVIVEEVFTGVWVGDVVGVSVCCWEANKAKGHMSLYIVS